MPISEERFNLAAEVIEVGVAAATKCGVAKLSWQDTFAYLSDDLHDDSLSPDHLLDLLTVAIMKLAVDRREHEAREDILRG